MKALLATVALTVLSLPAFAQQTLPLQANNAELPAKCRDKPVPARVDGHAYAMDGDTIAVVGLPPHIRIWGIQAAELRDKEKGERVTGMQARAALEDLLNNAGHRVQCRPTKWDRYCRLVAFCEAQQMEDANGVLRTPQDLGWRLLDLGLAYGFYLDDVIPDRPELSLFYASAEAQARKERRGLWPQWLGEK